MADKETKFNMKISYDIQKVGGGKSDPFTSAELVYNGMDLLQITVTQSAIAEFAKALTDLGFQAAAQSGFAAEVEKLKGPKK
jgi:hypothetical protein